MTKYLLPCECGEALPIETTQAGQSIACHCGRTLDVPAMRSIRQLEPHEVDQPPPRKLHWNATAGAVFAAGLLATLCGLAVTGYGYFNWSHNLLPPTPQIYIDSYVLEVDDATAEETLGMWKQTAEMRLTPYDTAPEVVARARAKFFVKFIYAGLPIVACGIVISASALFFMRRA